MLRTIIGMLSFLRIIIFAQNQRFIFESKFVKDSTEKVNLKLNNGFRFH